MTPPAPAVISGDCEHENWTARAELIRDVDPTKEPPVVLSIELTMTCVGCGAPMLWKGVRAGSQEVWDRRTARPVGRIPLISVDRATIMLPCEPHPPGERS